MGNTNWVDALSTDDLPADDVKGVLVAGRDIAVYTVGDAVYATDNGLAVLVDKLNGVDPPLPAAVGRNSSP